MLAKPTALKVLDIVSLVLLAIATYLALVYAPEEQVMGEVQRVFYFHVATAWTGLLGFVAAGVAGVVYLIKRDAPLRCGDPGPDDPRGNGGTGRRAEHPVPVPGRSAHRLERLFEPPRPEPPRGVRVQGGRHQALPGRRPRAGGQGGCRRIAVRLLVTMSPVRRSCHEFGPSRAEIAPPQVNPEPAVQA